MYVWKVPRKCGPWLQTPMQYLRLTITMTRLCEGHHVPCRHPSTTAQSANLMLWMLRRLTLSLRSPQSPPTILVHKGWKHYVASPTAWIWNPVCTTCFQTTPVTEQLFGCIVPIQLHSVNTRTYKNWNSVSCSRNDGHQLHDCMQSFFPTSMQLKIVDPHKYHPRILRALSNNMHVCANILAVQTFRL